jgi:retron-type reverse transcriptase
MAKRRTFDHLYPQVYDIDNLYLAWRRARKGKRGRAPAATFEFNLEENLLRLQAELQGKTYAPGSYVNFTIHEPKRRLISAAPFRDRVAHHALCAVIEPIFERRFIFDSYANRVGKGTHRALDRCQAFARKEPYVLQCDVKQFFPSVDHTILRASITRVIVDDDVLWLVDQILASGGGVLAEDYEVQWFPGDDLLAAARPRGLPIGNLTSQFWANVYLNELDQFVKRELSCRHYIRYVDDFLLFADDKRTLHGWRRAVIAKLAELRLVLHEGRAQVYPVQTGIPFLGFRVYTTHKRLKRAKGITFQRRFKALRTDYAAGRIDFDTLRASVKGWVAHARHAETYGLRKALFASAFPPMRTADEGIAHLHTHA